MRLSYAVNIQHETATVLLMKKRKNNYIVLEHQLLKLSELTQYLKKKSALYVSINQDDMLNESISIPTPIKKNTIIKSMIQRNFSEVILNRKILLTYNKISENKNDNTTSYQINGVYEENYTQILHNLEIQNRIKSATAGRLALLGLSLQCVNAESYFLIHTQGVRIDILAIHKGVSIFDRVGILMVNDTQSHQIDIINEITNTITYVQQNMRDIAFSTIVLSGSITMNHTVPEHLYTITKYAIATLYPNTFISGLPNEKAQDFILALGSYFVPKSYQFLPDSLLGKHQYMLTQNLLLTVSVMLFFSTSVFTYEQYTNYNDALKQHKAIKNKFIHKIKYADTYSQDELQKSQKYLSLVQKHLHHHPSDLFIALKSLIMLQKPEQWRWNHDEVQPKLITTFKKSFSSLDALHQFKKRFQKQFKKINTSFALTLLDQTNYSKMQFNVVISIQKAKTAPSRHTRRRR